MASLRVKTSAGPSEIPLHALSVFVGRDPNNDLSVDGDGMSREHCVIEPNESGWIVRDLGSRNGTFVNGARVSEHLLLDGDRIRCGSTELEFGDPVAAWADLPPAATVAKVVEAPKPAKSPKPRAKGAAEGKRAPLPNVMTIAKILVACAVLTAAGVVASSKLSGRSGSEGDESLEGGVSGDAGRGSASENPDQEWYLTRQTGDTPEGPLSEAEIRRAFRWGEITADAAAVMVGSSEWKPIESTRLASGYGGREPQSADEVSLDLSPRDFMRQYLDFQRYGFLCEDTRLLHRIAIEASSWPSVMREAMKAQKQLNDVRIDSDMRLYQALERARKSGVAVESPSEFIARKAMDKSMAPGWKSDRVEEWKLGDTSHYFVRRGARWSYLGDSEVASFIDLQTGEWRPEIAAMIESAPQFDRMRYEAKYNEVMTAAKYATDSIGKSTDFLLPFVERGCVTDIDRLFQMRSSIALMFSTNPTLLSTVQAELDAECGKKK